jgi:hypothetical protein
MGLASSFQLELFISVFPVFSGQPSDLFFHFVVVADSLMALLGKKALGKNFLASTYRN